MLSLAAHRKGHHKIEIKKEPVKRMSDLFFNKKFYMFDADVLDDFVREINSFVKVEMFNKGNIFIKYAERLTILFFSNVVFVSRGMCIQNCRDIRLLNSGTFPIYKRMSKE